MSERTCAVCGSLVPPEARFCPTCGTRQIPGDGSVEGAGPAGVTERRVVTVVFADLANSTELATRLDPERFREVITAFYDVVTTELASLRGRAEKFAGDAVLAIWGIPQAHDDDALRAIRAGITIRDRTERLGEVLGLPVPLRVRVGVNTGAVASGPGPGREDQVLVSGAAVNMAARLEQAAEPGEVLVGETTRQLTRHAVEFGEPRKVEARGFDAQVEAWPVLGLSPRSSRRTIPLVGRERELSLLRDTFERVRKGSRAHLVTVLGETGIGKSRLVDELLACLPEQATVLSGRASQFEEDVTFAPLAEMIRRLLGVDRDALRDDLRNRLREVVDGCCDPTESEQVAARLELVLGLGQDVGEEGKRPAEGGEGRRYRASEIRAGFLAFVEGLSRGGPVVAVFEDLHLARPGMLDLIEGFLHGARRLPLLVVAAARDALLDDRPTWGGGHADALTLRLEPLDPEDAQELVMAAGESLNDETAGRIATQAGGNPFFIIEITGMLMQEHPEHGQGTPHSHLLPPTVQAVVASRIDHVPPGPRDLLRKASVFAVGTFHWSELELVAEPTEEALRVLEDSELLVRDPDRAQVWRFRHEMLRDVAYESLPKRERQRLHLQVVGGLEREGAAERYPQAVAYHLEQAASASLDLDPEDRTLADRAVAALARAGDLARWRIESRTALDLYERALALARPEDEWGPTEARILSCIGEGHYWLGEFDLAASVLTRALRIGRDSVWVRAHASRFLGDIELNARGRIDAAEELFQTALLASRELGDPFAEARTLLSAGWVPYWRVDLDAAREMFERALEIARSNPQKDLWAEARALTSLISVTSAVGDEVECLELGERAQELGREDRDPFTVAVAQQAIGNSLRRMWRLEEAEAALVQSARIFEDLGAKWEIASALGDRGNVYRLQGRLDEAEADLRETLRLCREIGDRSLIPFNLERLVKTLLMKDKPHGAERELNEVSSWATLDDPSSRQSFLDAESCVALAKGEMKHARQHALEALEVVRQNSLRNEVATAVWWTGTLFGSDAVGGEDELESARRTLESAHWEQLIREPDLFAEVFSARAAE